jgi:hypothetical protein
MESTTRSSLSPSGVAERTMLAISLVRVTHRMSTMMTGSSWRDGTMVEVSRERMRARVRSLQRAEPTATSSSVWAAAWKAWNTGSYRR